MRDKQGAHDGEWETVPLLGPVVPVLYCTEKIGQGVLDYWKKQRGGRADQACYFGGKRGQADTDG